MQKVLHETCQQYVARRLSEGWYIVSQKGYSVVLSSPNGGILRPVDLRNDIETLRPDSAGSDCNIIYPNGCSDCPNHYDCVDEESYDGFVTMIGTNTENYERDLYNIENHSVGSGVINHITVYAICYVGGATDQHSLKICIKSDSTVTEDVEQTIPDTSSWETMSKQWTKNPASDDDWTWDDIDALEIGIAMRRASAGGVTSYCTQVYVEVDYTAPVAPTVTTQAASNIDTTTATGNGNITATGGENADHRGIVYGTTTKGDPGNTAPGDTDYDDYEDESGDFGTGAFTRSLTSLDPGTKYYARAYAHNSAGYSYGDEVDFTTAAGGVPQQAMHLMRMRRN